MIKFVGLLCLLFFAPSQAAFLKCSKKANADLSKEQFKESLPFKSALGVYKVISDKRGQYLSFYGKKFGPYQKIEEIVVSTDRKHFAFVGWKTDSVAAIHDGKEVFRFTIPKDCCGEGGHVGEIFHIGSFVFSPNSLGLAFVAS